MLFATFVFGCFLSDVNEVIENWEGRSRTFSAVEFKAEGLVTTTPAVVVGLGVPTKELSDKPLPIRIHAKIDLENGRCWLRREHYEWSVPEKKFRLKETVVVCDGTRMKVSHSFPRSEQHSFRIYKKIQGRWLKDIATHPIWLNSGDVFLSHGMHEQLGKPNYEMLVEKGALAVVPFDAIKSSGVAHLRCKLRREEDVLLEIDTGNENRVVSLVQRDSKGRTSVETQIRYVEHGESSVVDHWEASAFEPSSGRLIVNYSLDVIHFKNNCEFEESVFLVTQKE